MRGINKVILVATVGKDPELKYMPSGGAVVNLTAATNESWTDKTTGEKKERTEWHRLTFFGRLAEIVGEYVRKGSQIYVEGRLQTRDYMKEGQKHYSTDIIVHDMQMLGGRNGSSSPPRERQPQSRLDSQERPVQDEFDDDIPF